jgi:hypothetical protein
MAIAFRVLSPSPAYDREDEEAAAMVLESGWLAV